MNYYINLILKLNGTKQYKNNKTNNKFTLNEMYYLETIKNKKYFI